MRKGQYLYKRPGSQNWWLRLQFPAALWPKFGRKTEISLRTPDRTEAEIKALDHIKGHKMILMAYRAVVQNAAIATSRVRYAPGKNILPDGGYVHSDDTTLHFFDAANKFLRSEPNKVETVDVTLLPLERDEWLRLGLIERPLATRRREPRGPANDDEHLERWLTSRERSKNTVAEARTAWSDFRRITDNKPLKDCDYDDGIKLCEHYYARGNKSASVKKKLAIVSAIINFGIKLRYLKSNPLKFVHEARQDAVRRWPMPESDMHNVRSHLDSFHPEERLLWLLIATTGMRRGEAHSINNEADEGGIRYVYVGTKTPSSHRRVPLPQAVLTYLPPKIIGPLFSIPADLLGRRLLQSIRAIGVTGQYKDLHSLRHRAKDRLREAECQDDMKDFILGHDKLTVSKSYGAGPSVAKLKEWVEKIGY